VPSHRAVLTGEPVAVAKNTTTQHQYDH
jgi:hypothetical protein